MHPHILLRHLGCGLDQQYRTHDLVLTAEQEVDHPTPLREVHRSFIGSISTTLISTLGRENNLFRFRFINFNTFCRSCMLALSRKISDFQISWQNLKIRGVGTIEEGEKYVHDDDMNASVDISLVKHFQ